MTKEGWHQQRSCTEKKQYYSKLLAKQSARRVPPRDGRRAKVYRCHFCNAYHVGHHAYLPNGRPRYDIPSPTTT